MRETTPIRKVFFVDTISRVQSILRSTDADEGRSEWRAVRVEIDDRDGVSAARVTLAPGDRLVVMNRTSRRITVNPLDFFGNSFGSIVLEPQECGPALLVSGLWFQVDLRDANRRLFPLDVYLAPNKVS